MQSLLNRVDYLKSIQRILNNNAAAFEGKAALEAAGEKLAANLSRLSELVSGLVYPVSFVSRDRKLLIQQLRNDLRRMSDIGCLLAKQRNDEVLLTKMKQYRSMSYKLASFALCETVIDVAAFLEACAADGPSVGLAEGEIESFRETATQCASTMDDTRGQLDDRRSNRKEVDNLLKDCTAILRGHFDPFVRANAAAYPQLSADYMMLRFSGTTKARKSTKAVTDGTCEIEGTITDAVTGDPIANATVVLPELELVTKTDDDGSYCFDELPLVECSVSCSMPGYLAPDPQPAVLKAGETTVLDFQLQLSGAKT